jgi:hypothetical protein
MQLRGERDQFHDTGSDINDLGVDQCSETGPDRFDVVIVMAPATAQGNP